MTMERNNLELKFQWNEIILNLYDNGLE